MEKESREPLLQRLMCAHADVSQILSLQHTTSRLAHMDLARHSPSLVKAFALSPVWVSSLLRPLHSSTDSDTLVSDTEPDTEIDDLPRQFCFRRKTSLHSGI